MDWLKKAYDSLGEEITKTFDSSQSSEDAKTTTIALAEQGDLSATPVAKAAPSRSPEPASAGDQSSLYVTPPTGAGQRRDQGLSGDGGWGQWENQPLLAAKSKNQGVPVKSPSRSPRDGSPSSSLDQGHQQREDPVLKPDKSSTTTTASLQMLTAQPKSPLASSTPAKAAGKSQLDSLSREDLVKYVRKQAQLLQKTKAKCDELSKENDKLKKSSAGEATDGERKTGGDSAGSDGLMEELQVVRSERDRAVREEKTLRQSLSLLEQETEELSERHKALQDAHTKLKEFCQEQQKQLEDGRSSSSEANTKLEKAVADLERERSTSEQLVLKLTSLKEQLKQSQDKQMREVAQWEEVKKKISDEKLQLERDTEQLKNEVKCLRGELDSRKAALKGDMESLRNENKQLTGDIAELKEQLRRTQEDAEKEREAKATIESEVATIKMEASKLEAVVQSREASIEELSSENTELKKTCGQLEAQLKGLEKNMKEMRSELDTTKQEKEELLASSVEGKGQADMVRTQLERQLHELKNKLESSQSGLEGSQERNKELEQAIAAVQNEKESLKRQVSELSSSLEKLERTSQDQSNEVVHQLRQSESQLKNKIAELQQARERLSESESKLKNQTSELEGFSKKNRGLEEAVVSVQNENERLRNQVSDLSSAVELSNQTKSSENSELTDRLRESESQLKEREKEFEVIKNELEQLKSTASEQEARHSAECEALKSKESDLKANLTDLESQFNSLQIKYNTLVKDNQLSQSSQDEATATLATKLGLAEKQVESLQSEKEALSRQLAEEKGQSAKICEERDKMKASLEEMTNSHKEESKKLKVFILKMKKELSETKERESGLRQQVEGGQSATSAEVEQLKEQLQKMTITVETQQQSITERKAEEEHISELQKQIELLSAKLESSEREAVEREKRVSSERDEAVTKLQQLVETHELLQSEMTSVQSDLATANSQANTHRLAAEKTQSELQSMREELTRERQNCEEFKQKLTAAEKELKSSAVINLELEDYQRSMKTLEEQLTTRSSELERVRKDGQLQHDSMMQLKKELELMDEQRGQSEETVTKLKQLLMRNKKELGESKKREGELQQTIQELHSKMEAEKQVAESAKVEISQMAAKIQSLQSQSESSVETLHRTIRSLEHKLGMAQGELGSAQAALAQSQQEYEQYKVRVHSVLKQKSSAPAQSDLSNELKKHYESELGKLQSELQDTNARLSSTLADHEELLVEHEQLSSRHEQLLQESEEIQEDLQCQLRTEEARHSSQRQEQSELISQLRQEIEDVTNAFKNQLHSLQEDHHKVVDGLKEELSVTQTKLNRLQHEADAKVLARAANNEGGRQGGGAGGVANKAPASLEVKVPPVEQRSSGEGMDQSELESSFPPTPLSREDSSVSFERLLSTVESESSNEKQLSANEVKLYKQLKAGMKKIEHLTELLRESEASSVRLGDQAKLLKEEIRRLERNQEREQGVSNLEYLKNIVLKFLHTQGPERSGLIPIVTKLLQLSPQEIKYLQETVKGNAVELPGAGGENIVGEKKGWTGYLHRWTGY